MIDNGVMCDKPKFALSPGESSNSGVQNEVFDLELCYVHVIFFLQFLKFFAFCL